MSYTRTLERTVGEMWIIERVNDRAQSPVRWMEIKNGMTLTARFGNVLFKLRLL